MTLTLTHKKAKASSSEYAVRCEDCNSFIAVMSGRRGEWIRCPYCGLQFKAETIYRRKCHE
jgi:ribosomal protein S27E